MALFGFFNFNKEGPGISKNAPKKRTFIVFFEVFFRNFWKFIPVSLIYSLISLPQLTSGLAAAGITNVARNTAREKHSFGLSDFFETIKKNWKQALPVGIINTLVYAILLYDVRFFIGNEGIFFGIGLGMAFTMLFIFAVMNYFIWTLLITFKFSLKQIYKNSFKFVFINLKNNLICFFSQVLFAALFVGIALLAGSLFAVSKWFIFLIFVELAVFIIAYPIFKFLLVQFCVFPAIKKYVIDPYYAVHPDEDLDKRRDLGIYTPEETNAEEDENVFND